jgi:hypothetical protein
MKMKLIFHRRRSFFRSTCNKNTKVEQVEQNYENQFEVKICRTSRGLVVCQAQGLHLLTEVMPGPGDLEQDFVGLGPSQVWEKNSWKWANS